MARRAFGLLLDLRDRSNGPQLLSEAIAFLEALAQIKTDVDAVPIILAIRLKQLPKS
jgi:hypothetical protein